MGITPPHTEIFLAEKREPEPQGARPVGEKRCRVLRPQLGRHPRVMASGVVEVAGPPGWVQGTPTPAGPPTAGHWEPPGRQDLSLCFLVPSGPVGHREGGHSLGAAQRLGRTAWALVGSGGRTPIFLEGILKLESFLEVAEVPAGGVGGMGAPRPHPPSPPLRSQQFA